MEDTMELMSKVKDDYVMVSINSEGTISYYYNFGLNPNQLVSVVGALERLKYTLLDKLIGVEECASPWDSVQ